MERIRNVEDNFGRKNGSWGCGDIERYREGERKRYREGEKERQRRRETEGDSSELQVMSQIVSHSKIHN